jgi:S-formylglutathione hydrolase FrmB
MPDPNGPAMDTECVNSKLGQAETYLTEDVPTFMRIEFNAATGSHSLSVGGLSAGGTCSLVLTLRNPTVFTSFADYSGFAARTYLNDDEQQTIQVLFDGSRTAYLAHNPVALLKKQRYPTAGGWFEVGEQDQPLFANTQRLRPLAESSLEQTCYLGRPGGHDFSFWAGAFKNSLPWLSWRMGLTPAPHDTPADCVPAIG